MAIQFIYDEKTSRLYAPDGTFLKEVYCPNAIHWNQLRTEPGESRWKGCDICHEKVIDLDAVTPAVAISELRSQWSTVCIHASSTSGRVIFLKDDNAPQAVEQHKKSKDGLVIIQTARTIEDINRAAGMGYWPDLRWIEYDTDSIKGKISIGQNTETGHIQASFDYRRSFATGDRELFELEESADNLIAVLPFKSYYGHYQQIPIAAYLIPKDFPNDTQVIVHDPIEDLPGKSWNQGDVFRAHDVIGHVLNRKVVIAKELVRVKRVVG